MAAEDTDKILEAIQASKQDIFSLINARLDTFKNEILQILDTNLKLFRHELDSDIAAINEKLAKHENLLVDHDKKIKDLELGTDVLVKNLFFKLVVVGLVGLAVNSFIIIMVVSQFIKK